MNFTPKYIAHFFAETWCHSASMISRTNEFTSAGVKTLNKWQMLWFPKFRELVLCCESAHKSTSD